MKQQHMNDCCSVGLDSYVIESVPTKGGHRKRIRRCPFCNARFVTIEVATREEPHPLRRHSEEPTRVYKKGASERAKGLCP